MSSTNSPSQAFVYSVPMVFNIDEKMCSLHDEVVVNRTSDGVPIFKLENEGSGCTSHRKVMYDMQGHTLYKNDIISFSRRGRMRISRPSRNGDRTVFYLRQRGGFFWEKGAHDIHVWKGNSDHGAPYMHVSGNLLRRKFVFKEASTGSIMGTVAKQPSTFHWSGKRKLFFLTVEPGYDASLLTFLAIVLYLREIAEHD